MKHIERSSSFSLSSSINNLELILKRISLINFVNQPLSLPEQKYWCQLNVADKAFIIDYLIEIIDDKQYFSNDKSIILIENTSIYELKKIIRLIKNQPKRFLFVNFLKANVAVKLWRILRGRDRKFFVRNYVNILNLFNFMPIEEINYYVSLMSIMQIEFLIKFMTNISI